MIDPGRLPPPTGGEVDGPDAARENGRMAEMVERVSELRARMVELRGFL